MQLAAILAKSVVFKFTPSGTYTVLHLFGDAGFCQVGLTQATDNYRHFCQTQLVQGEHSCSPAFDFVDGSKTRRARLLVLHHPTT